MAWTVRLKESVIRDLRWFGRKDGRLILKKAEEVLSSDPNIMKIIPLSEAKTNLSRYANLCHKEPVIVTINGVPSFQLVPLEEDDDLVDRLIELALERHREQSSLEVRFKS